MINNYLEFKKFLNEEIKTDYKPTLLIHSCCGPCSSHVLTLLQDYFNIRIFYYNPNIYPILEFKKRLKEQQRLIQDMKLDIQVVEGQYDYKLYLNQVKGLEKEGERSQRCYNCYEFRIKEAYEYAKKHHFNYYTTTLSISPYKNSDWINEIGNKYQDENCKYLYSNFKKENGYQHSIKLSEQYHLYRQEYCGCEFSLAEHEEMLRKKQAL